MTTLITHHHHYTPMTTGSQIPFPTRLSQKVFKLQFLQLSYNFLRHPPNLEHGPPLQQPTTTTIYPKSCDLNINHTHHPPSSTFTNLHPLSSLMFNKVPSQVVSTLPSTTIMMHQGSTHQCDLDPWLGWSTTFFFASLGCESQL